MDRTYKAFSYIQKELTKKKFKELSVDSAEFDWAFNDLVCLARFKFKLSDDEADCLNSMLETDLEY